MTAAPELMPRLIVDTREQTPLMFRHLEATRGTLQSGDYSVAGLEEEFAVERKSVADLVGSVTRDRDRFSRELHRLRGFRWKYLLIVGTEMELARLAAQGRVKNPLQVKNSILAFSTRYGLQSVWVDNPDAAAHVVESWAFMAYRESMRQAGCKLAIPQWVSATLRAVNMGNDAPGLHPAHGGEINKK